MKKIVSFSLFLTIVLLALAAKSNAQSAARVRTVARPLAMKSACPTPIYTWINGTWVLRHHRAHYVRWRARPGRQSW